MDKKLINEDISNMKYLFGYKPGRVISEQDVDYTSDDYLDVTEIDEEGKRHPERQVRHKKTNKIVGTHKKGVGFTPTTQGEKLGFEFHPTDIPHGTRLAGTEIGDFDYDDDDFISKMPPYDDEDIDESFGNENEIFEDKDDLFLRRRASTIEELIDKNIEKVNDEGGYGFSDEYEFASNIISWVVNDLMNSDNPDYDYDEIEDFIKENFGEYILSQYVEEDFDDDDDEDNLFEQEEPETDRYMFFSNLEQIHRQMGILLEKDPEMIHSILENGHDWAQDHIATAKESIDQVFDFIMNEEKGEEEMDESFGNKIFESRYSDSLSVNTSIKLHRKSSKVVKNFLNSLSTEFIETKFIMISDCEYADFSDIDICNLPNLAYINLRGTENNFNEQGYDCASEEGNSFYVIE
jgi:hypothetical protein